MKKTRYIHILNGSQYVCLREKEIYSGEWECDKNTDICIAPGERFLECLLMSDVRKIDYPLSVKYYFENNVPLFSNDDQGILYSTISNIIKNFSKDKGGEHYYFDTIKDNLNVNAIYRHKFNDIKFKGYNYLQKDLINLFSLDSKMPKQFMFINEFGIYIVENKTTKINLFLETKKSIENTIRVKNYFLCDFLNEEISQIVDSIFQELFVENKKNECMVRDNLIFISDDDFNYFEKVLANEIYENLLSFENKYQEIVLLEMMVSRQGQNILSNETSKFNIKQIDLIKLLDVLCDYRKLNISMSNSLKENLKEYGFQFCYANYDFIKKNRFLLNKEKTEYKKRLDRVQKKLNEVEIFNLKEKEKIEV